MQLGFVTAILPELSLEEVVQFAAAEGFDCIEVMCWPKGKAERRYAGITHIDVAGFGQVEADQVNELMTSSGVSISGLGYYPNPLVADADEANVYIEQIKRVIHATKLLGLDRMNTFIGRDHTKSVDDNWPRFQEVWKPLIDFADEQGVRVGIENCPMFFSDDEWPGGKNLAKSPKIWRRMFEEIPSKNFGLNYDPSHLVWQCMDYIEPLSDFAEHIFHVHAKDACLEQDRLNEVGLLANPLEFHTPKLPGLGQVDWQKFLSALGETGYDGPVCIEVEDRDYEGSLESRKEALRKSRDHLRPLMP
jgi:sugar phosphate isomerase/epimerase